MSTQSRKALLLATDLSGSVLNAVDTAINSAIAYTPYGYSPLDDDPQSQHRFNGYYQDLTTGYYPLGNGRRMYSPILMRFFCPDILSPFEKGGVNSYAYCGGDPKNRVDRSGQWFKAIGKSLGLRPNAALNKAVKINSKLETYPYKTTGLFANSAAIDGQFGPTKTINIYARARKNKLYIIKEFENSSFKFQTTTPIELHVNSVIETTKAERLTVISKTSSDANNFKYVENINKALSNSPKGLSTKDINRIKHSATNVRKLNEQYKLDDILNRADRSRGWPNPSKHDSNYWADK